MIRNCAFLAAVTVFLMTAWVAGKATILAPYKRQLFDEHGWFIAGAVLVVFLDLFGIYYGVARLLFLRDTGRKLGHLDRQLQTRDAVFDDVRREAES